MAEIILPPEEEQEETPQAPELNVDKPTENSKVITIEFEAKKTNKVSTKDTNQQLYTTDTDAWFEFKEKSLTDATGTYSLVLRNLNDGSIFQRTGDFVDGVAYYKIPEQEIRHAGKWRGQLVYTLENGNTTAREFGYDVKGHILDGKDVREIVVEDFETLMSQLRSMKDNAELELADLVNAAGRNELERQQFYESLVEDINDLQANYQELLDTGVLQTNINEKLGALEEEYAPKLTEVTAQLAHIHYDVINEGAVGDGITDDTAIIQSILDKMVDGDTIFFPNGIYRTTDTIQIKRSITFNMDGYILADHDKVALQAKNDEPQGNFNSGRENGMRLKVNPNIRRVKNKGYELKESAIGFEIWNCFSGEFNIYRLINNYVGLKLVASKYGDGYAGTSYCKFIIGVIDSFKENIVLHTKNTGWVTQNQFYSGSLTGSKKDGVETIHVNLENNGSSVINQNLFFGIAFEGHFATGVRAKKSNSNNFLFCRYEMPSVEHLFYLYETSRFNRFEGNYLDDHMRDGKFYDNEDTTVSDTIVVFQDHRLGSVEYYNEFFFIKPRGGIRGTLSANLNQFELNSIPENWKGKIVPLTQGKMNQLTNPNNSHYSNGVLDVDISIADEINVRSGGELDLHSIRLINPPKYSKEITILFDLDSGINSVDIINGEGISRVTKKTDLTNSRTNTIAFLYFYKPSNTLYVIDIV